MINKLKRSLAFALSILLLSSVASARLPRASSQPWSFHHPALIRDAGRTSVSRGAPPRRVAPTSLRDPAVRAAVSRPLPGGRLRVVVDLQRSEVHIQETTDTALAVQHETRDAQARFEDADPDRVPDAFRFGNAQQRPASPVLGSPGVWTLPFRIISSSPLPPVKRTALVGEVAEIVRNESRAWGHPLEFVINESLRQVWCVFPDRAVRIDLSPATIQASPGITRVDRDPVAIAKE